MFTGLARGGGDLEPPEVNDELEELLEEGPENCGDGLSEVWGLGLAEEGDVDMVEGDRK